MAYTDDFINQVANTIVYWANQYGYNYPSAIIAQACLESNWGRSELSRLYFNYFGMTAGSSWSGPTVTYGRYTYRVYNSMSEGLKGYFDFIRSYSRYDNLIDATSAYDYCYKIKADGWAEDPDYANKLILIIRSHNLTRFDSMPSPPGPDPDPGPSPDPPIPPGPSPETNIYWLLLLGCYLAKMWH